jgi:hypothetical protein
MIKTSSRAGYFSNLDAQSDRSDLSIRPPNAHRHSIPICVASMPSTAESQATSATLRLASQRLTKQYAYTMSRRAPLLRASDTLMKIPATRYEAELCHIRLNRGILQPGGAPQLVGLPFPCRVRKTKRKKGHQTRLSRCPLFRAKPKRVNSNS